MQHIYSQLLERLKVYLRGQGDVNDVLFGPDNGSGLFDQVERDATQTGMSEKQSCSTFLTERIVEEYARMAGHKTIVRAREVLSFLMGPEVQKILGFKPVPLSMLNDIIAGSADGEAAFPRSIIPISDIIPDDYTKPEDCPAFFWNLNEFVIPLWSSKYDPALDDEEMGRYCTSHYTLTLALEAFKKQPYEYNVCHTVFSVIRSWLSHHEAPRKYDVVDWRDGMQQLQSKAEELLQREDPLEVHVALTVLKALVPKYKNHAGDSPPMLPQVLPVLRSREEMWYLLFPLQNQDPPVVGPEEDGQSMPSTPSSLRHLVPEMKDSADSAVSIKESQDEDMDLDTPGSPNDAPMSPNDAPGSSNDAPGSLNDAPALPRLYRSPPSDRPEVLIGSCGILLPSQTKGALRKLQPDLPSHTIRQCRPRWKAVVFHVWGSV
ncbi:hypothetical protein PFICI_03092 [Pestalotiopsis fici W106-1]|uniref:Uncharacterized protein n=1 Tax=Pestalotiopsis fici (strain W106-1 / CGMCC3.15140) TaxID=1229662 RepID=W3XI02_PESFW|nr:uncharacterized protein PFICI_03092 [Pestalotiopsis fici W106-1]ETS85067.1 hypothetical protein PFICI_03092 [Pestalotiopsis fici W106-1]